LEVSRKVKSNFYGVQFNKILQQWAQNSTALHDMPIATQHLNNLWVMGPYIEESPEMQTN
jgi:hypothetical protein